MMSGSIEKLGRNEVDLMWQRPKAIKQWTDAPQPKMQLFMKMFATESGKEVADAFTNLKVINLIYAYLRFKLLSILDLCKQ
ncbi:hypothetical protein WUBG_11204 [Wuchereria bancrofti]|uniref:Uncharacterized protein n=1 Tax=Wuchereria bancrofti TaxID=6293 RepID=J9ATU3_WUCBA|nr:hypothetical protein WUBG_11204 [Wuchereria bancrofti]